MEISNYEVLLCLHKRLAQHEERSKRKVEEVESQPPPSSTSTSLRDELMVYASQYFMRDCLTDALDEDEQSMRAIAAFLKAQPLLTRSERIRILNCLPTSEVVLCLLIDDLAVAQLDTGKRRQAFLAQLGVLRKSARGGAVEVGDDE
jgi:DNA polymerase II small subunit/DNA polymerase delta subunit B